MSLSALKYAVVCLVGTLICVFVCASGRAQSASAGSIVGQVTDQSDATIAGAELSLIDVSTNTPRTTTSNDAGRYIFANIPPGTYVLTVTKPGFRMVKIADQTVNVGSTLTLNAKLNVGSSSETVEVTYTPGAELQTMSAAVGTTISGDSLLMLPNIGRETAALATLQPGVTSTGATAGAVQDQNTYQLDGGNISDDMSGTNATYTPSLANSNPVTTGGAATGVIPTPIESIEEFKVATSNQTADFNGSSGSQIQMVTKRGKNQFHGALYEFYLGSRVGGANTWENNRLGQPIASNHRNRFGGALGGPLTPSILGGKTYFFVNYEGLRYPFSTTIAKSMPSAALRAGVIQIRDSAGKVTAYNLNPFPVTVTDPFTKMTTLYPAGLDAAACAASGGPCDPRGIGINSYVKQIWNNMLPLPNDPSIGDGLNTQGFRAPINLPVTSNFAVIRLDHDFGAKWHFMGSYRYYHFSNVTQNQVDVGGVLPGDKFGQFKSRISRPLVPFYYVAGLQTNITPSFTNDFHFSYTRNFWEWHSALAPPQPFSGLSALPAPLEIGGESGTNLTAYGGAQNALIPYNVDTQDVRERYWDGQDKAVRDDLSLLHGNHLFQFGGSYQRNLNIHQRDDNGVSSFTGLVYVSGGTSATNMSVGLLTDPTQKIKFQPAGLSSTQLTGTWLPLYEQVLGIVTLPQEIVSRSGSNLTLNNPPTQPVTAKSTIPTYHVYFSDSWHIKSSFTFTYGLAWTLEMPPVESTGLNTLLVDASGTQLSTETFLANRKKAALNGEIYLPQLGYQLVTNSGKKYLYNPFYGGFSPHLAAAWTPRFDNGILGKVVGNGKTVVRGGWSRIFGRLNGVDLLLVPLLGSGSLQPLACAGASSTGQCLGSGKVDPTTAFRIGTDGTTAPLPTVSQTLPQPVFPGVNAAKVGDTSQLDPNFKPNLSDEFSLTIQRELTHRLVLEVGYIGRRLRNEYQAIDLDSVPFMMTLGGQSFAKAFDSVYAGGAQTPPQPFFEAAFAMPAGSPGSIILNGKTVSNYCNNFTSCTAAVAAKQSSNIGIVGLYNMWSGMPMTFGTATALDNKGIPVAVPSLYSQTQLNSVSMETSSGWGNYNGAFVSLSTQNYHGVTARSNFTWSRAMGTGDTTQSTSSFSVPNPFDLHYGYGPQSYDYRFLYNLSMLYQPSFFKSQAGIAGHLLGGWSFAPLFIASSGAPLRVTGKSTCSSTWGEVFCGSTLNAWENAVPTSPYTAGNSVHYGVAGSGVAGSAGDPRIGGTGANIFADPAAVFSQFRPLLPGTDTSAGGNGILRGLPNWNLDLTIGKEMKFTERFGGTMLFQFTNVLNHLQLDNPTLSLAQPTTFGLLRASLSTPRQLQFGLRLHF